MVERDGAGTPLVIVGPSATVVVDGRGSSDLCREVQRALTEPDPVVAFLSVLTTNGVRDLPTFAFVSREGASVRILLRGALLAAKRDRAGIEELLSAGSVSTWSEVVRDDCADVVIQHDDEDRAPVVVITFEAATNITPSRAPLDGPSTSAVVLPDETMVAVDDLGSIAGDSGDVTEAEVPADAGHRDPAPEDHDEVDLSHLFETRHVGVEAAAVRAAEPADAEIEPAPPAPTDLIEPDPVALLPPPSGSPASVAPPPGLISGVPSGDAAAVPAPDDVAAPGDHDGLTISPAQLAALRVGSGGPAPAAPVAGPQLQAVSCPSGHLNPPHATSCRSCHTAIADRAIRLVGRPSLGRLSFDDGRVADIDRPLLIGRKPTVDGLTSAAEVPALVVLPDPDGSLSRTHAEVRIDGWEVLVVDRSSTNGTYVEVPGQPPVLLRPLEPCLISPGTRITFADVAACVFETGLR